MKFNSLREYFYRLNTLGLQLTMVPLIIFIFFYSQTLTKLTFVILDAETSWWLLIALAISSFATLTGVQVYSYRKAKLITTEIGLGIKLEKIGDVLLSKMKIMAGVILIAPCALLISGDSNFAILFGLLMLWYFVQWPSPGKVSRMLKLKGDEKLMVITRGEAFK